VDVGLRDDKKRETRQAILDTTLALFREKGYGATRIQDVVARLRISEGTFFNYFPTKQSVLEAFASDLVDPSIDRLHENVTDDRPVPVRLEDQARAFARSFEDDRELVVLLARHTDFFSGSRTERLDDVRGLLTELFAEGQKRHEIRDDVPAAQLTVMLMAVSLAMVHTWVEEEKPKQTLEERLLLGAKVMLSGCVAPALAHH
jgi:AcrR family transcriptional regulator